MRTTLVSLFAVCAVVVLGCDNRSEELEKQMTQLQQEKTALETDIVARDKYFEDVIQAINEVHGELEQAKAREAQLLERTEGAEGKPAFSNAKTRQNLLGQISTIGSALKENRQRIANLQARVKSFQKQFAGLNTMIENLRKTVEEREKSIAMLEVRVQGLETTLAEKTQLVMEKDFLIDEQQARLNTAYYVVGSREELEKKGIINDEGGFLWFGSTTTLASGIDPSHFTPLDRTRESRIEVSGRVDEIVPKRKTEYFKVAQHDKKRADLTILSPEKFWQDRYLVIIVN